MMKFSPFNTASSQDVIQLFAKVFSHSEGEAEGQMIGELVSKLIDTTDKNDLLGYTISLDDEFIGAVFYSRLTFPKHQNAFILSPMAIAPEHQRKGLGQKLIQFSLEQLKSENIDLVMTYGDPNFYSKIGFSPVNESVIKAPLKLTYPEGWLIQSLNGCEIEAVEGAIGCVDALNDQKYW